MSDCKQCANRRCLTDLAKSRARYNNPKEHPQKYGVDHGQNMLLGDLADNLVKAAAALDDDKKLCDFIDQEFLFGAWRSEMEPRDPDMLRNLRGLIVNLALRSIDNERLRGALESIANMLPSSPGLELARDRAREALVSRDDL